ncbi:MAG: RNA methyltransferase [Candidatus Omnitrophota bacterium]
MSPTIAILLVDPENPDNIGAVARAMKNMGLRDLRLVRPPAHWDESGKKMAMSAADVLDTAAEFQTVQEAIADLQFVVATTRRTGPKRGPFMPFEEVLRKIQVRRKTRSIGLMFGRESKGLDNDSLRQCDAVTTIPVSPAYPSINLAQAVMIFAFALFDKNIRLPRPAPKRGHFPSPDAPDCRDLRFVSRAEIEEALDAFAEALRRLDYGHQGDKLERIRATLHGLIKRSGLLLSEAQMIKGLARRIREKIPGGSLTAQAKRPAQ